LGTGTIEDVAIQQYFERSPPFAILSALIVATAIVLWLFTSARLVGADRQLLTLAIGWLVMPTAVIVAWSAVVHPVYTPRYLCFTAPAMAVVLGRVHRRIGRHAMGSGGCRLPSRRCRGTELCFGATQSVREIRYGLQPSRRSDRGQVSAWRLLTGQRHGDVHARTYAPTDGGTPGRLPEAGRPEPLAESNRPQRRLRYQPHPRSCRENHSANVASCGSSPKPITRCPPAEQGPALPPGPLYGATPAFAVPHDLGFRLVERWQFNLVQVIKAVR